MENYKYELNLMEDPRLPFRIGCDLHALRTPRLHWHENIEILYCISGEGQVRYNETLLPMQPGDIAVISSEVIHCLFTDTNLQFHFLTVDRHFCDACGIPITSLVFASHLRDPDMAAAFLQIIEAYRRYIQTGAFFETVAIRSLLLDFLYRLCKDHLLSKTGNLKQNDAVKTAITYIREHLSEPMSLEQIAQHTGMSVNSLLRKFKRVMGRSVFDTILLLRCTEAKRLIGNGFSVSDAAHACGFENMSYFTRTFKRYYQVTPSHYLQKKPKRSHR